MAPIVAFVVAFLTGATMAKGPAALLAIDVAAARVVAIEQEVCPAAEPAIAGLALIKSTGVVAAIRARLRRDAALVCADAPVMNTPAGRLAWLTDLGHAPAHIRERIREADVLVVEANYCPQMLKDDSKRPWSVKQRISGRHGHLSNESARDLLLSVDTPRWRHVFLAHLSRECNSPAAVEAACAGVRAALRCDFSIVGPGGGTPFYDF